MEQSQTMPLVMLHGLMGQPANWKGIIPCLPRTCNPVAIHFPFFEEANLNSVQTLTDYAQHYIDEAGWDKFVVMGNSLGGHVAMSLTFRVPDRVAGLVLTASSGLFERSIFSFVGRRPTREWIHDKICEVFHDEVHVTDELVDQIKDLIYNRASTRTLIDLAKSAKRDNLSERMPSITCPTLLIWGRQDQITPPDVAEEFRRLIVSSELIFIDKCSHAPMIEHPHEFGMHVAHWWNRRICFSPAGNPKEVGT
ncbi:MAG: alpha/beta hydrolase [Planctomycetes bacterium]|nr:alpha/beta hydrolase [Planctomycetota bacterium]